MCSMFNITRDMTVLMYNAVCSKSLHTAFLCYSRDIFVTRHQLKFKGRRKSFAPTYVIFIKSLKISSSAHVVHAQNFVRVVHVEAQYFVRERSCSAVLHAQNIVPLRSRTQYCA